MQNSNCAAESGTSKADRRKDEFLATLAHELRNPLAPMRNVLEILRLKEFADPQLSWSRDVFDRQLQHMTHLVDDLLEVSRITQGKLEFASSGSNSRVRCNPPWRRRSPPCRRRRII